MLAGVDQPPRPQDPLLVEESRERQAADLVREPESRRCHVGNSVEPWAGHELALLSIVAIASQDDVHPFALILADGTASRKLLLAIRASRGTERQLRGC